MKVDLASLFRAVKSSVTSGSTPEEAWSAVVYAVDATGRRVPDTIRDFDVRRESVTVGDRLGSILAQDAPPPHLAFYHFGLFEAWNEESATGAAGLYFAGGTGEPNDALRNGELAYRPENGYLESQLLDAIKAAANHLGDDYNIFDYGLMFGAAGVIAKFGARQAGITLGITVGFDSGDFAAVA